MLVMIPAAEAGTWAACALAALRRPYPHKLDHLILHAGVRPLPVGIHPVFDGCYDWHSSVHMHWSLLRLARQDPGPGPALGAGIAAQFESLRENRPA
jgi:hypothetical protein